ncbi:MAG: YqiJ family protein [Pseudomonadota bacterium]
MSLLADYNLPFMIALGLLLLISVAQIVGLGDMFDAGDADVDFDVDPDGVAGGGGFIDAAFSLLGLGRVPFLIWLMVLLFLFSAIGVAGQATAISLIGTPLNPMLAAVLAAIGAIPVNSAAMRPLAKLLPQDETTAVGLESLVRRDAEIQIGTARAGSPARSKVIDAFGHPHFVMVEPHDAGETLGEGETVLLVRREGETFYAIRYESPLLGLE